MAPINALAMSQANNAIIIHRTINGINFDNAINDTIDYTVSNTIDSSSVEVLSVVLKEIFKLLVVRLPIVLHH